MNNSTTLDRLRAWSALLPLLLLLAAAYWLNQQVQPLPSTDDRAARHTPDVIVSQFSATTLSEQGTPRFMLAAQKMLYYPDDDSTHLEAPRLTSLAAGRPALHATAKRGTMSGKGDEILLHDEVKIVRAASRGQSELVFVTSYLRVIPETGLADTDRAVTMTDAHNKISAVGMHINHQTRVIKLLAHVSSAHESAKN